MTSLPNAPVVYTPESVLRQPARFLAGMRADLGASVRIGVRLARRDLDAQYRQSLLGYLWVVLPVLVTAGLWIALNRATVLRVDTGTLPYWAFVLSGSVFWQAFIDALNGAPAQFQANRILLARVNFPKEALLVSAFLQVAVSLALRMVVVIGVCMAAGIGLPGAAAAMMLPLVGLLVVGMVIGTFLVPLSALFGDINRLVLTLATPLMLVAPVAYPPQAAQGLVRAVMDWNPLTPLIAAARDFLFTGQSAHAGSAALVAAASLAALLLGWLLYRVAIPVVIEKLEA